MSFNIETILGNSLSKDYSPNAFSSLLQQNQGQNLTSGFAEASNFSTNTGVGSGLNIANSGMGFSEGDAAELGKSKTPWGMIGGVANSIVDVLQKPLTDNAGATGKTYDFDADLKMGDVKKKESRDGIVNTTLDAVGMIPGTQPFVQAGKLLYNIGTDLFQRKATDEDRTKEYQGIMMAETAQSQKDLYSKGFEENKLAYGGYASAILDTAQEIEIGGTHEENQQGGVTISPGNKAEEGEVVVDLAKRLANGGYSDKRQFVFTNRF